MSEPTLALRAVAIARSWSGTPYHHQASLKGHGADCLGLVRGVWRELFGREPETPPPYAPDWAETGGREDMLAAARRHFAQIAIADMRAGDVVIFRMSPGATAKHIAILASDTTIIHAMEGVVVSEVALTSWWRRRIAAAFRFTGE